MERAPLLNHFCGNYQSKTMNCNVKMWQHSILLEQCAIRALFFQNKITMRNSSNVFGTLNHSAYMQKKKEKGPTLFVWIQHQSH